MSRASAFFLIEENTCRSHVKNEFTQNAIYCRFGAKFILKYLLGFLKGKNELFADLVAC